MANEKFSQFATGGNVQAGDITVGLRAGVNTQFTNTNTVNSNVYTAARLFQDSDLNATYNNGASGVGATLTANVNGLLLVDNFAVNVSDRIVVADQTTAYENGIYTVTQTGSVSTPFILTRATDFDTPAKIQLGGIIPILVGADYTGSIAVIARAPAAIGINIIGITSTMQQSLLDFKFLQSANDLSDVTSATVAFNNISPLTTKGDLVTNDGTNDVRLGVGTDGYVLEADSTQPFGIKWAMGASPVFTYPYTFTGQIIFATGFSPEIQGFSNNAILYIGGGSGQIQEDVSNFYWDDSNFNFIATSGMTTSTPTITNSAFIGGNGMEGANTVSNCIGLSSVLSTINQSAYSSIINCNDSAVTTSNFASMISSQFSDITTCNYGAIIAGFENNVQNCDHSVILGSTQVTLQANNSFAAAANLSTVSGANNVIFGGNITLNASNCFIFNDSVSSVSGTTNDSFNIVASNGIGLGTVNPQVSSILDIESSTKAVKFPNINGTGTVTTPVAGHIIYDTSSNQFQGYNGTTWNAFGGTEPVFTYPFTFTGQIIFGTGYAPEIQGFSDNSILFIDGGSGQVKEDNSYFQYVLSTHSMNYGNLNSFTGTNFLNAMIASSSTTMTGNGNVALGSSSIVYSGAPTNAVAAASNSVTMNGAQNNFAGGAVAGNVNGINTAIMAGNNLQINSGTNVGIFSGSNNTISAGNSSAIVGGVNNTSSANNSVIAGGSSNTLNASIQACFIAGGISNNVTANYGIALGSLGTVSAPNTFLWNDGITTVNASVAESFNIIASGGVGIGTTTPQSSTLLDLSSSTKALRVPQMTATSSVVTPAAGMIMFDTTSNQFWGYNGSAWVILG